MSIFSILLDDDLNPMVDLGPGPEPEPEPECYFCGAEPAGTMEVIEEAPADPENGPEVDVFEAPACYGCLNYGPLRYMTQHLR